MLAWWNAISLRERVIYVLAALIVLFVILDSLVLSPVKLQSDSMQEQIEQARDDLDWMKQATARLSGSKSKTKTPVKGSLVTYVNQQVTKAGLKLNLQKMTPIKDHSVRLRLDDVAFNDLLKFLKAIDQTQVEMEEVRLLPSQQDGLVNATLVISQDKTS